MVESMVVGLVNQAQSIVGMAQAVIVDIKSRNFTLDVNKADGVASDATAALQTARRLEKTAISFAENVSSLSSSLVAFVSSIENVNNKSLVGIEQAQEVALLVNKTANVLEQVKVSQTTLSPCL